MYGGGFIPAPPPCPCLEDLRTKGSDLSCPEPMQELFRKRKERLLKHCWLNSTKNSVSLDPKPSLERSITPPPTAHSTGRTVFIVGSSLSRIVKAAAKNGHMIVDLTVKGWIPKSGKIGKLCETLKKLNLTEIDTVVIDSMSNTAYLGTDEDGLPIPAEKSEEDGWYHLSGDL